MDENKKAKQMIQRNIIAFVIVIIVAVIAVIILKYHVEGEQNMPFNLSELMVVSTAEGHAMNQTKEVKWDEEIYQTNDVYLTIEKNKNYKQVEPIKSIELRNITVNQKPRVGDISFYIPVEAENTLYEYKDDQQIENNITFQGAEQSDISHLKIANQGSTILFRVVNKTGKEYTSNEDELKHDGTLLSKVNITSEEMKASISFDLVITLESGVSFAGNISFDLPTGDIATQGISSIDKSQLKNIVFKRE